jgi:hypothetical protein
MSRPDYARQVRWALADPTKLCGWLGLTKGATRQAGGLLICCPVHSERNPSCSVTKGPDGTSRVRCFGCDFSGDALTLVATCRGLSLQDDFREVLIIGAEISGHLGLAEEIKLDGEQSDEAKAKLEEARKRRVVIEPPEPLEEREYPPVDEVRALWDASTPVSEDVAACAMLVGRKIDPDLVTKCNLARVVPSTLPSWATYRGKTWNQTGHRMIVRAWDCRGQLRSVRAWRVAGNIGPKRLPPAGHKAAGLVQANGLAVGMLRGRVSPILLSILEGEPDWLTGSTMLMNEGATVAVGSGSWNEDFARRVPTATEVHVCTHADPTGDKYARYIIDTLGERCPAFRWRVAG